MRAPAPTFPPHGAAGETPRSPVIAAAVVVATFALGLARLARLVHLGAVNVLFGDQWDFLLPVFRGEGAWAMFLQQHGPHRQGAGGWIQWLIYSVTDWDVRAEAWIGIVLLAIAAATAVGLAVRIRGRLAWWDAALVLIILSPLHWEMLLLAPNLAHSVLPLCLTLLLAHAWLTASAKLRLGLLATAGVLCTFTGFAFCASVAAVIVASASMLACRADRRAAGGIFAVIAAGLAVFFVGYHWAPAIPGWRFPVPDWWNYGTFGAYMEATLVGLREKTPLALLVGGACGLATLAVWTTSLWQIAHGGANRRTLVAALLTGTSLVYIALTAVGRLPASVEAAFMWRYTTLTMTGALGVILFLAPWIETTAWVVGRRLAIAALCSFAVILWLNIGPEQRTATIAAAKRSWVQAYLKTHDLAQANALSEFWVYPPQPDAPHVAERLRWLEQRKLSFFRDTP